VHQLHAQTISLSNLKRQKIATNALFYKFDSVTIIPNSFYIKNISPDYYNLDELNCTIHWKNSIQAYDSVELFYRVLPLSLTSKLFHLNYDDYKNNFLAQKTIVFKQNQSNQNFIDFGEVKAYGVLGRSISFGNNQDAVVNSNLNLQLSGLLGDSILLSAIISDNNFPIQADGSTKNLNEFDKIFIQAKKNNWQTIFGDNYLRVDNYNYLHFNKKNQGVTYQNKIKLSDRVSDSFFISASVAKGKFSTNTLIPLEGNQGPYKLRGNNNEFYLTVLSGSERVYIDGDLLQRGYDLDYVIDYNMAEISFTSKRLINKDQRIRIEFEYTDRNYINSDVFINNTLQIGSKSTFSVGFYSNADAKNSVIDQSLTNAQKVFLKGIGDSIQNAYTPNSYKDSFATGKILYQKIDTVYNSNMHDSVFVFAKSNTSNLFNVSFTYVGVGKGNYRLLSNANNGKVFEWVQPSLHQQKQGEWEPVSFITTPKLQQIITFSSKTITGKNSKLSTELAVSRYDKNLFSNKDKNDDNGFTGKINYQNNSSPIKINKKSYHLETNVSFEAVNKNFKPIERIRNVEFLRDWNILNISQPVNEDISNLSFLLNGEKGGSLKYNFTNYNRSDGYHATKNDIQQNNSNKNFKISSQLNLLQYTSIPTAGYFFRPQVDINKQINKLNKIRIGASYKGEYNHIKDAKIDTLTYQSFTFDKYEFYINSKDENLNKYSFNYFTRINYLPYKNQMIRSDVSKNLQLNKEFLKNEHHQFKINLNYRNIEYNQINNLTQKNDENLLGRFEYLFDTKSGFIKGNSLFENGSGQEQKIDFVYVPVPVGQGEYTWNDYNKNGIQELNEFELAKFQDQKKYIRVYTPSNAYVKVNYVSINYGIDINPASIIKHKEKFFNKILCRSNLMSTLQFVKKELANQSLIINPFNRLRPDTALITKTLFFSNTYFYNRNNPRWGFDVNHKISNNKSLLTYGFESRNVATSQFKLRINLNKEWMTILTLNRVFNELNSSSVQFRNRNYAVREMKIEPSFTYTHKSKCRAFVSYVYSSKTNQIDSLEHAVLGGWETSFRYAIFGNSFLNAKLIFNKIDFNSNNNVENSPVSFFMLDGQMPGKNLLWNMDFTQRLQNNLEISFQYEGRKQAFSKVINIGRASVRAIF